MGSENAVKNLIEAIVGAWPTLDATDQKIAVTLYHLLVEGRPVEHEKLASHSGVPVKRVASAFWLVEHLAEVPVHVIPCVLGRIPENAPTIASASTFGSIFPAVWSFQLALRSRGLGSVLTTLHLFAEAEVAKLLGIPENVTQVGLLPVAYTKGTDFKVAKRPPASSITSFDSWDA